jgi:hypothetical protein
MNFVNDAGADFSTPECIQDARRDYNLCISQCKEAFQVQKDCCRNIDHECAEGCREGFETCVEEQMVTLADCRSDCNDPLASAKENCRTMYPAGSRDRDSCVDQAQDVSFACRDECREKVHPALVQCRTAFKSCMKECPAPEK